MILLDTSGLLAALVADEPAHERARRALETEERPYVLSPFVLAELDYLLLKRGGFGAELALLREVERSAYQLTAFDGDDVAGARATIESYADQSIGLTDASIVVLAGRYGTERVLTLDERHFRTLRTPGGKPFTLLPADA